RGVKRNPFFGKRFLRWLLVLIPGEVSAGRFSLLASSCGRGTAKMAPFSEMYTRQSLFGSANAATPKARSPNSLSPALRQRSSHCQSKLGDFGRAIGDGNVCLPGTTARLPVSAT